MTELKTKLNDASVHDFLSAIEDENRRKDCFQVMKIMEEVTGEPARMWGASIVGFGMYHYVGASGREGDWLVTGFSPRKNALTLYVLAGFDRYGELMSKLGKYKTGRSCLYVNRLSDIDLEVLKVLIHSSFTRMTANNPV